MKKTMWTAVCAAACAVLLGCPKDGGAQDGPKPGEPSSGVKAMAAPQADPASVPPGNVLEAAQGNNAFALDLYGRLRTDPGNVFFSPFSIRTALALVGAGARGKTAEEMAAVLRVDLEGDKGHRALGALAAGAKAAGGSELKVANALWGALGLGFESGFLETGASYYGAPMTELDFAGAADASRKTINLWVEENTNRRIRDLIPPGLLSADTQLVATNAVWFKGAWASKFDAKKTREGRFRLSPDEAVTVPMMHQNADVLYGETDAARILELDYAGKTFSMVLVLPREDFALAAVEAALTPETLKAWLGRLSKEADFSVTLPRFKMEAAFRVEDALSALGMPLAFSPGKADFSGIAKTQLFVSAVLHKAFLEVNEEGTEAAAATAVVMDKGGPSGFAADQPFLLLIRHKASGAVLFMGRVANPGN